MKTIIIDTNNLIHQIPEFRSQFIKDNQQAQLAIVEAVKSRLPKNVKVVFFFDGYSCIDLPGIIFSGKKKADELLRDYIEKNCGNLTVVSNDRGITDLAAICSCEVKRSEMFWKELNDPAFNKNINHLFIDENDEKPDRTTKKDFEFFKNKFT
jgi:hypothetical protein